MPTLPQLSITSIDADTGVKQLDVVEDALQSLIDAGIVRTKRPREEFENLPPITQLDDTSLGLALQNFQEWVGFLNYELAVEESRLETSKAQHEFIQSSIRIALKASEGRMTVQDKTDIMRNDARVSEAHSKYLYHYTKYNILKSLRDRAQSAWETVSRRITQRSMEVDKFKRGENVSSMPASLRSPFRRG